MKAEIICIGTELLLGDTINTNASWIARELANMGVSVYHHIVVGDNHQRLAEAYRQALSRADLILCTGGLGPTQDDMTKEALAQVSGRPLERNALAAQWLVERFDARNYQMAANNWRQADFPMGSIPLFNPNGTAPGCHLILENQQSVFLMPGPPREMKPMFESYVKPWIEKQSQVVLRSRVLHIIGIGESTAEEMIKDLISVQTNPTIAPYASYGEIKFRITAQAQSEAAAFELIEPVERELRVRFGDNVYGSDDDDLETVVFRLLKAHQLTIACAESCTGGFLAARLINVPGVSEVLLEGFITYSNESKIKRLAVSPTTLAQYGAVSAEVAAEMAVGVAQVSGANVGVATTGIAGPGGATPEKPVGLVYVGLAINGRVQTQEFYFPNNNRAGVRSRTVIKLLDWLRRELENPING